MIIGSLMMIYPMTDVFNYTSDYPSLVYLFAWDLVYVLFVIGLEIYLFFASKDKK